MPLPWKKSSRFSRMVADLQSPNNRGSSLVVETGFPTSLVDLFVKNRDQFKKPFKNKRHNRRKNRCLVEEEEEKEKMEELLISDPVLLSNSRDLGNLLDPVSAGERGTRRPQNLEELGESFDGFGLVGDDKAKSCHLDDDNRNGKKKVIEEEEAEKCVVDVGKGKSAVVWVLFSKLLMLMLVVLACSNKKLAVGITMSAFLLISLEYVAEHVLCFSKPGSNARLVIEPLIQRVVPFIHISKRGVPVTKEVKVREVLERELIVQGEDDFVADSCALVGSQIELGSCVEEIQVLESNIDGFARFEEDRSMEANLDLLSCEKRWGCLDAGTKMKFGVGEDKDDVVIGEKQCNPLAKMRGKIVKKLVPKKLQDRKRRRKNKESEPLSSSEGGSCWGEDKSDLLEEEEIVDQQGLKDPGKRLTELLVLEGGDEKDGGTEKEAIHHASRGLQGMNGIIPGEELVKKRTDIRRKHNSSYLILFIIILSGLVCGRILALVLTVASCLMFKIVTRCKRCKQAYE